MLFEVIDNFLGYKKHLLGERQFAMFLFLLKLLKHIAENQRTLSDDDSFHQIMLILKVKVKRAFGDSCALYNIVN